MDFFGSLPLEPLNFLGSYIAPVHKGDFYVYFIWLHGGNVSQFYFKDKELEKSMIIIGIMVHKYVVCPLQVYMGHKNCHIHSWTW